MFCDEGEGGVVFPQGYDADTRPLTVWTAVAAMPCEQCLSTREARRPRRKMTPRDFISGRCVSPRHCFCNSGETLTKNSVCMRSEGRGDLVAALQ